MRDASSDTRDCNALRPTLDAAQAATRPRTPARGAGRNPPGRPGAHRPRYAPTPSVPDPRRAGGRGEGRDGGRARGHRAARAAEANVPGVRPHPRRGAAGTVSGLRGLRARIRCGPVRASQSPATKMARLLPAAIRHIAGRYGGDAIPSPSRTPRRSPHPFRPAGRRARARGPRPGSEVPAGPPRSPATLRRRK